MEQRVVSVISNKVVVFLFNIITKIVQACVTQALYFAKRLSTNLKVEVRPFILRSMGGVGGWFPGN